jgi:photosystem II Psb27 protein
LTGNYTEDTLAVVKSLRYTVQLPADAADRAEAQADARAKISAFAARYHLNTESASLYSYATMRTALNALASYYNGTTRRSVPEKVRDRVLVELDRVEAALAQGR